MIALLTIAYYGVYFHVVGLRYENARWMPLRRAAGWVAAIFFVVIVLLLLKGR